MTSKSRLHLTIAILAGALLALSLPAGAAETAGIGVEITLEPLADYEGGYTCTAVIVHLGTGDVLAAPTIRFLRGEKGGVTSQTSDGAVLRFNVEIDEEGSRLAYLAEYLRDDKLLSAQKSTLTLDF